MRPAEHPNQWVVQSQEALEVRMGAALGTYSFEFPCARDPNQRI